MRRLPQTHTVGGIISKKLSALAVTFVAFTLAACGAGSVGAGNTALVNGTTYSLPTVDSDLAMTATLPKETIGEELPAEGVGSIKWSVWKAMLSGSEQRAPSFFDSDPWPYAATAKQRRKS
jgi:hypothetical protein